jgi:hypothetical protein
MERRCFKCGETKPLDDFYRHPMMADGHLNKCAECTKADVRSSRAARLEYYQAYDRARNKQPERVEARRERAKASPRRYPESDPLKRAARVAVGNAVRDGKLLRPPECQVCAVACEPHGHHEDYSRPLDVIWVCTACHAFIHAYWRAQERIAA